MAGDIEITDEMVEAACRAYWPLHWPQQFSDDDAGSIRKHIRASIEAVYPPIAKTAQAEAREAAAERAKTELENWGIDLQHTSDAYRDAAVSGEFNGRRIKPEFAKEQAVRFKERADAIYAFGEPLAAAIRSMEVE